LRSFFLQSAGKFHFESTTTRSKLWAHNNVTGDTKRILQVSLNLVEHIFGGTTKDN
jgi:hypothetical protein